MAAAVVKHSLTTGRENGRGAATRQGKGGEGVKIRENGKGAAVGLENAKAPVRWASGAGWALAAAIRL